MQKAVRNLFFDGFLFVWNKKKNRKNLKKSDFTY